MNYHVVALEPRASFRLWVRFADGVEGEADLSDIVGGDHRCYDGRSLLAGRLGRGTGRPLLGDRAGASDVLTRSPPE